MTRYHTFRAQGTGSAHVEPFEIVIRDPFPSDGKSVEECNLMHRTNGTNIAEILALTLPGGTLDALIAELLRRKATSLVVAL